MSAADLAPGRLRSLHRRIELQERAMREAAEKEQDRRLRSRLFGTADGLALALRYMTEGEPSDG